LRTGLCFNCQRNLNEKRRTERKRPNSKMTIDGMDGEFPNLIYAVGPSHKKFRYKNGSIVELASDAIIVNGTIEGTRPYGEGYGFQEIGVDLITQSREAAMHSERLVHAVSSNAATVAAAAVAAAVGESGTPSDEADAVTAAAAVAEASSVLLSSSVEHDLSAANSNDEDISALYHRAFQSLNKSIYLLTQWKASWDAAIAAAQETVADPTLADAVASAAAVAAASSSAVADAVDASSSNNMVSLLLAADDQRKEDDDIDAHYDVHHPMDSSVDHDEDQHVQHHIDVINHDEEQHEHSIGGHPIDEHEHQIDVDNSHDDSHEQHLIYNVSQSDYDVCKNEDVTGDVAAMERSSSSDLV